MNVFIKKYSTPFITGLFVVSAISGTALFFHWMPGMFHSMHTWLSMVLLLPFVLHVWRNWGQFMLYFRNPSMLVACVVSLAAAAGFMVMTGHAGGNPAQRVFPLLTHAPLGTLAPLFHATPDELATRLTHAGYSVRSTDETLEELATAAGQRPNDVLIRLLPQHAGHRH
ncbi:hypothetical protein CFR78_04680 [Komagataeibacter rhaeticus]|uniref:Uncharacterized protein n=1 Tax=Komagataeibacter rhaeticus TaxID=215221 RepID=A0A181CA40_9PROT|nr:hypothetical protein [Komagataeibacter rhaeticus]ATU73039.1 hypothetical protein CT154_09525 [Komagataeibacter xylinus]EGG77144.1 hypothetical protein SXCC_02356 [Gluconacetobacter sp. SXCC-1]KDU97441.1 hypothetical protein GLUCORHAEAF1_02185 [Komagataeibacter rhaeticus AF1]MBL7238991.1 hypothetical protein [Komagataeibacter rhaeticus]PYD54259.1 hypothetical protein CFR78_04680 [Komagataeibacter rhaeticus]